MKNTYIIFLMVFCSSCVSVAPYQKMYLNDEDMQIADGPETRSEANFHTYREGASGAKGGKAGGGCGCN